MLVDTFCWTPVVLSFQLNSFSLSLVKDLSLNKSLCLLGDAVLPYNQFLHSHKDWYVVFHWNVPEMWKHSSHREAKFTFPCHSETEPEVQALLVSDVTPEGFRLTWLAEEDSLDTFVIMVSQTEGPGQPRELVLGGEERSIAITDLKEDTEYTIEIFGLIVGRRSKSIQEIMRTGIWYRMEIGTLICNSALVLFKLSMWNNVISCEFLLFMMQIFLSTNMVIRLHCINQRPTMLQLVQIVHLLKLNHISELWLCYVASANNYKTLSSLIQFFILFHPSVHQNRFRIHLITIHLSLSKSTFSDMACGRIWTIVCQDCCWIIIRLICGFTYINLELKIPS